ncbi:MAG: MSHA biogenesis protein MshN [Glaciecola sp.]|jgi:MSHA biogenesis protein MshN
MSVVNKMLKDLEQRDKKSVYEADYVPVESRGAKSRKLVVGVLVLVIGVAFAAWIFIPKANTTSGVTENSLNPLSSESTPSNLSIQQKNESQSLNAATESSETDFNAPQKQVLLSELDQATLNSLENAKRAEAATKVAEAKLADVNRELSQANALVAANAESAKQDLETESKETTQAESFVATPVAKPEETPSEPGVLNVSSSNKSTSGNRMLEQRIQLSLKNGDTAAALKDLNSLISLEPRNASARKRLASLEFAQANPKRAAFLLDQGIKLAPNDSSMRLMLARLLFRENRNAQALALLNEHPKNVIADNDLLSFRAALAEKQKDYTTSLQDYAVLLQRQPGNARWMLGLAISQDKQKMHAQAVITYKKVKSSNQLSAQVVSFVDGRLAALAGS